MWTSGFYVFNHIFNNSITIPSSIDFFLNYDLFLKLHKQ